MLVALDTQEGTQVYAQKQRDQSRPTPRLETGEYAFSLVRERDNKQIPLINNETLIGRNQNFHVIINDPTVAMHHATLIMERG